jgi:tape measure domain-containing protein
MATEIASAYLSLYARMPGVQNDIAKQLGDVDADKVGEELGKKSGVGYTKGFAAAGAVGGLVATLASAGAQALGDLVGDAVAASDATSKFAQTLQFAGVDTTAIDNLKKSTKAYADDTVYDLATVQNTTAQLAANGVKDYDRLTEAAGNLNAVAGGNQDTFSSVAMMLTQTAGAGKLTTENWNQLSDAIPGAAGQLQSALMAAGAYTGNFRDAMAEGQITADEFNAALLELGTQPVAVEAAKSTETMEGALGNLNATIVGGLAGAIDAIKPVLTDFVNGIAGVVTFIGDNIDWIGPLAAGIGIVVGAIGLWTAAQWLLNAALTANPIGLIVVGIGLLIGAIILLVQNWDVVVAWLTDVWNGFVSWFMGIMDAFLGWWNGLWTAVWEWIVSVWNNIVSFVTAYFTALYNTIMGIGSAIAGWWNGLWNGIVSFFTGVWNNILGVISTVQGAFASVFGAIADVVRGAFEGVVSVVKGVINGIIGAVNGVIDGINSVSGVIGGAIGVNLSIGHIPKLAAGGVVSRRPGGIIANIGEGRYDEAVVPLSPGVLSQLGGGGGLRPGERMTLIVGDREFEAYVGTLADNRIGSYDSQRSREARRGERV